MALYLVNVVTGLQRAGHAGEGGGHTLAVPSRAGPCCLRGARLVDLTTGRNMMHSGVHHCS